MKICNADKNLRYVIDIKIKEKKLRAITNVVWLVRQNTIDPYNVLLFLNIILALQFVFLSIPLILC